LQDGASASCPPDKKDNIKSAKERVFDILFHSIEDASQIPETLAYGEFVCAKIDEVVHRCIVLMFRMETVDKLEAFWNLYQTGGLLTSLSHDILTPQRRQHMIMDVKNDGIELEESDFCLQITIKESDYLFVKDVLTRKNGRFEIERDIYFTNSLSVIYIYIYVWKLNQTVLELDL
jgi:hypothetical protein